MSTTHQDKSSGKARQRSRKADRRGQKGEQQSPKPAQRDEEPIGPTALSTDASAMSAAATSEVGEAAPVHQPLVSEILPVDAPLLGEVLPADIPSTELLAGADKCPVSVQTIAKAYGDYSRRSFEESRLFVEKLIAVRSLDKVIELQSEFARQTYVNLVAESQKIYELYSEFAKQIFGPWERLAARLSQARR